MSGCRSLAVMLSGSGPGQVMPVTQPGGGSPGDGLVDAGLGEQGAGLPAQAEVQLVGQSCTLPLQGVLTH
jgi:hypothetical protein